MGIAYVTLPSSDLWIGALLGAIVAPTDAAIGASIMTDTKVPPVVRRLLNIESGLNDGIATPFVNIFLAGALSADRVIQSGLHDAVHELVVGVVVGLSTAFVGGFMLRFAKARNWTDATLEPIIALGLAIVSFSVALGHGGNGFIAAFLAGITFGTVIPRDSARATFLVNVNGELLSLIVWFVFGSVMLVPGIRHATWGDVAFGLAVLTIGRLVPVAIALIGTHYDRATVYFIGWFGPRGLASIVFTLLAVDALTGSDSKLVLSAATVTIVMSVVAHGISAGPLADIYSTRIAALRDSAVENTEIGIGPRRRVFRGRHGLIDDL